MGAAGGKGPVERSGSKLSAVGARFFQVPRNVALIGLLYAIITASVVYLLGGGRWTILLAFLVGGGCAAKIAALVRADILQDLHPPDRLPEPLSRKNGSASPYKPEKAELDEALLSPSGDQRADDTADV